MAAHVRSLGKATTLPAQIAMWDPLPLGGVQCHWTAEQYPHPAWGDAILGRPLSNQLAPAQEEGC